MATGSSATGHQWHWPEDIHATPMHANTQHNPNIPGAFYEDPSPQAPRAPKPPQAEEAAQQREPKQKKSWAPRTCRICLETVLPTYTPPSTTVPGILQSSPSVTYISEDPETGRLIRPCKCKGGSKYVHEGCLQAWRHSDPGFAKRNYWQCPTCRYSYRLERMAWGRAISSTTTQIVLTIFILLFATFILGFVADPIINFCLDPYSALYSNPLSRSNEKIEPLIMDNDVLSWADHFLKGLASLGLLSFSRTLLASPWRFWNLRYTGIFNGSGRTTGTGRDRLANISWITVLIGVATFLWVSVDE